MVISEEQRTLVEDNIGWVKELVSRYVRGGDLDRDDFEQAAFLRLLQTIHQFDPERGAYTTWATVKVYQALSDHYRKIMDDTRAIAFSLDAPVIEGEDATLADLVPDTQAPTPDETVTTRRNIALIRAILRRMRLRKWERELVAKRLLADTPIPLSDFATKYGCTLTTMGRCELDLLGRITDVCKGILRRDMQVLGIKEG